MLKLFLLITFICLLVASSESNAQTCILLEEGGANINRGIVMLHWTAPGDDGSSGTAAVYDLKYSLFPITAENFDLCASVEGIPSPKTAGEQDTVFLDMKDADYFFCIKAADEVGNWSGISNVVSVSVGVQPPDSLGYR